MLTADRLILIFRNNAGTPLSTLRGNAATLKYNFGLFLGGVSTQ